MLIFLNRFLFRNYLFFKCNLTGKKSVKVQSNKISFTSRVIIKKLIKGIKKHSVSKKWKNKNCKN